MFGRLLIRGGIFHLRVGQGAADRSSSAGGGGSLVKYGPQPPPGGGVRRLCWLSSAVNASDYGCQRLSAGLKK